MTNNLSEKIDNYKISRECLAWESNVLTGMSGIFAFNVSMLFEEIGESAANPEIKTAITQEAFET